MWPATVLRETYRPFLTNKYNEAVHELENELYEAG